MRIRGLYLRGSIYWLNFSRNGRRCFVSLETGELSEAIKRAATVRASPALSESRPFEAEIEHFLSYKIRTGRFTRSTASMSGYVLRAFARHIGKVGPQHVTGADIQRWYNHKLASFSAQTANTYANVLRSFFRWCVDTAKITHKIPVQGLDTAKESGTRLRDFCTESQRDLLISSCKREDLAFVLFCGFHAGLRKNEIIEARPFWFDIDAGLLHLRKTSTIQFKDREERTIPITNKFLEFLKQYGTREPYMLRQFVTHGVSRYRYDFSRPFKEHVRLCELPWVTPHTMRHTFASLLASAGVSLFKISVWLGDSPMVVEGRYARLKPRDPDIERSHHSI